MRRLAWTCVVLIALARCATATETMISWPGWECSSTEELSLGRKHRSFPLAYLFDNNPATAWVFSGTGRHREVPWTGYALDISRGEGRKPVVVDSIWIMNGYNKSRDLFLRNNRITQLKLSVNDNLVKTVSLADTMGWHKISIPRRRVSDIYMQFTKFARGRDNDICVSGIALYDRGRKIDFKMPNAVEFTEGSGGDCG